MAAAQQILPAMCDVGGRIGTASGKIEILLRCCGNLLAGGKQELALAAGVPETEWNGIITLAELHGVLPLFCKSLSAISRSISANVVNKVRHRENLNARRALLLTKELLRITEYFQLQKISALPYKGPALAQLLYADVTKRQAGDIDLLVRPSDVTQATEALRTLGFRPHLNLSHPQQSWYLKSGYEYAFAGPTGENMLELKWKILPHFYAIDFDLEGMFRKSQSLSLGGNQIPTLSPEDLLLVLCVHAAKHAWAKLGWLCDIVQLVKTVPLNWTTLEEQAKALRIERIVALNFLLAKRLLKVALPNSVCSYIKKDPDAEEIAGNIASFILQGSQFDTESLPYFQLMAKIREHGKDRTKFWWRLGTTPGVNEWSALKLSQRLRFLYRGVRLYRLGRKLISGKLRRPAFLIRTSRSDSSHKLVTF